MERQDPRTGLVVYYNRSTGETSNHRPGIVHHTAGILEDEEAGKGAWVPRVDPKTKKTYYYNPVLHQTSWFNPDDESSGAEKKKQGLVKSLSTRLGTGAKEVSKRLSVSNAVLPFSDGRRSSARYSLSQPPLPTNRTSRKPPVKLGHDATKAVGEDGKEATSFAKLEEDRFTSVRKLKYSMEQIGTASVEDKETHLRIDVEKLIAGVDWNFESADFEEYAKESFSLMGVGTMIRKAKEMPVGELVRWSKKMLKKPLHTFAVPELQADAKMARSAIMCYMGDKSSTRSRSHHAHIFFEQVIATDELLVNEVYALLIKQTNENPKEKNLLRGLNLLNALVGTVPPPAVMLPYVKSHLKWHFENSQSEEIKKSAGYAMVRLLSTSKARLEIPTAEEIAAVAEGKPLEIAIHFINHSDVGIEADTWTTVGDFTDRIEKLLGIADGKFFSIFEVDKFGHERHLEREDRVLDVLSLHERESGMSQNSVHKIDLKLYYKMRLFFPVPVTDDAAFELSYYQAVHDVLDARYPCTQADAIKLAAYEIQAKFGDYDVDADPIGDDVGLYVQHKFYHNDTKDSLKASIVQEHMPLKGMTKLEARVAYLDMVQDWPSYGSTYFFTESLNPMHSHFPQQVVLAISCNGFFVIDPVSKDHLTDHPYSDLVTWGFSATTVVMVIGNLKETFKYFFGSAEGYEINSLIHAYTFKLADKE